MTDQDRSEDFIVDLHPDRPTRVYDSPIKMALATESQSISQEGALGYFEIAETIASPQMNVWSPAKYRVTQKTAAHRETQLSLDAYFLLDKGVFADDQQAFKVFYAGPEGENWSDIESYFHSIQATEDQMASLHGQDISTPLSTEDNKAFGLFSYWDIGDNVVLTYIHNAEFSKDVPSYQFTELLEEEKANEAHDPSITWAIWEIQIIDLIAQKPITVPQLIEQVFQSES